MVQILHPKNVRESNNNNRHRIKFGNNNMDNK